jgi:hypothetical protein
MSLPRLKSDFVARRGPRLLPLAIAVLGVGAVTATLVEHRMLQAEAAGLELRSGATHRPRAGSDAERDPALTQEVRSIAQQLATPWGVVLDDLEAAGRDTGNSIAVLSVQPDRETRRVTLVAEARSLPAALNYVQRLQQCKSLLHPLLDSHEVRTDSAERPVRVQITAEWKLRS